MHPDDVSDFDVPPYPAARGEKLMLHALKHELRKARAAHPVNIVSLHEGFAIIQEEVDELWDEVRKKSRDRRPEDVVAELIQVGAMAIRTLVDLGLDKYLPGGQNAPPTV